jgi:hypothetical protein
VYAISVPARNLAAGAICFGTNEPAKRCAI